MFRNYIKLALKYDAHGEISGLWNGIAYSSETQYIIKKKQDIIMKFSPIRK